MDYQRVSDFEPAREILNRRTKQFALAITRLTTPNLCEVEILLHRGGRRVPTWLQRSGGPDSQTVKLLESLPLLRNEMLFDLRESVRSRMLADRVVPRTKSRLFSTFISTNVCATPESLSNKVGISIKTARVWLSKASSVGILQSFASSHELFFVNVELMQLIIEGHTSGGTFLYARLAELEALRRRSNWLEDSRIAAKFPEYRR